MAEQNDEDDRNGLSPFLIKCEIETLRQSSMGAITGSIHTEVGGFPFPDDRWSDFVVVVLTWWLKALARLGASDRSAQLRFMDGPYAIDITVLDGRSCSVEFVKRSIGTTVLGSAKIESLQLMTEAETVAGQVVRACIRHGFHSPDVEELRSLVERAYSQTRRH